MIIQTLSTKLPADVLYCVFDPEISIYSILSTEIDDLTLREWAKNLDFF